MYGERMWGVVIIILAPCIPFSSFDGVCVISSELLALLLHVGIIILHLPS